MIRVLLLLTFTASILHAEVVSRELLSELHSIRSEIKKAVFDRSRYQQDIIKSELDIENQKLELAKTEVEVNEVKEKIINRIATLYKIRRAYPQGNWLSMARESDFLRKSYYLKYLNEQDRKLIAEFKNKKEKSHKLKNKVEEYRLRLVELQKQNESKFAELDAREKRQRDLIKQIREAIKSQQASQSQDENFQKKFFSELRGDLNMPLIGPVVGNLGIEKDPRTKLATLKTGILVSAAQGTEVKSVYDGEVLHTGQIEGWGPTVIIDHGESYYSVYSQIKNLSVRPGDRVIAKQKLAEVSAVTYHKENSDSGLYFELRHFSEPVDPREWFSKQ